MDAVVDVRRAGDRFRTATGWLDSRHSFSYGAHYDPGNTHFGLLLVDNEDVVRAGAGYGPHPHRDVEIVTWVLDGVLVHQDSTGRSAELRPGAVQRLSAGSGVVHAEGAARDGDVHFVQMWVQPDDDGPPAYAQANLAAGLARGGLVVVASGLQRHAAERAVALRQARAALHVARLRPGAGATVPAAPFVHLFVARGAVDLEGAGPLGTGDAARLTGEDGRRVTAGPDGGEVLVWEMHGGLG
jgi:redox-sensitive bicupin YhaK (pirin superfamily)